MPWKIFVEVLHFSSEAKKGCRWEILKTRELFPDASHGRIHCMDEIVSFLPWCMETKRLISLRLVLEGMSFTHAEERLSLR
ncbi:hypothetical protein CEXT_43871 [Caerostris extrusa]|uniref:Uncharacterized protein n=1 Tax=Caerostris extrusa TaxID=172846 RepID=A0AAV4Y0X5_CAEEX|nr:hypothetical protein CEXT_43871 [Caerostris extrusa]